MTQRQAQNPTVRHRNVRSRKEKETVAVWLSSPVPEDLLFIAPAVGSYVQI